MRGPVVYCLEEVDNGKDLHLLSVKPEEPFVLSDMRIEDVTVKAVQTKGERIIEKEDDGIYHVLKPKQKQDTDLTFVPYFVWANRGQNEMQVWTKLGSDQR